MAPQPHSQAQQRYMFRSSVKHLPSTPTKQLPKRKSSTRRKLNSKMWRPNVEKLFIKIMIKEINKGKTLPFGRKIWSEISAKLNERCNHEFTSKQCREKYQRIRRSFNHFTRLIRQKGFSWDAEANTVIAEEETWQKYLLANKHAKKFRKEGMANYKLLALIFNKATATGVHHRDFTQDRHPPNSSCGSSMDPEFLHTPEPEGYNSSFSYPSSDSDDEDYAMLELMYECLFIDEMIDTGIFLINRGHLVRWPPLKYICPLLFGQWKVPAMLAEDEHFVDMKISVLELVEAYDLLVLSKC